MPYVANPEYTTWEANQRTIDPARPAGYTGNYNFTTKSWDTAPPSQIWQGPGSGPSEWTARPGTSTTSTSTSTTNVLVARKPPLDLSEPLLDPETAADLLFQELGGVELADMLSYGTISGINQHFRVITNMNDWKLSYDPLRLISDQVHGYGGAIQLPISLAEKIPDQDFIFIERYNPTEVVTDVLLDLIIILNNIEPDEELEIQVVSNGKINEVT